MPNAVCIGELLIDFVSTAKDLSLSNCPPLVGAPGGAPANVAVGLARLGVSSGFVGKIGDDPFGEFLRATMAENSVDATHLVSEPGSRTTLAFNATRSDGKKDIFFYRNPGADILLHPDDINEDYMVSADVLHFGSVSLSHSPSREATLRAVEIAQANELLISYDPNLRLMLWDSADEAEKWIWKAMPAADVVKIAEEEWEFITGTSDLEAGSEKVFEAGPGLVVVTRGEQGCYYDNGRARGYLPGFAVDVLDPLGAGDGFVAAMLAGLLRCGDYRALTAEDLDDMLTTANAAGALTTQRAGVIPALPTPDEIKAFVRTASFRPLALGPDANPFADDELEAE
ncbi:MAG: carbohydrate kinase [Armatimonadota bacterium]|nr:MAG: carbohydrate kinase [Armatimonadota bacterium]